MAENWEKMAKEFEEMLRSAVAIIVAGSIVAVVMMGAVAVVWSKVK